MVRLIYYIRQLKFGWFGGNVREARLRCLGHVWSRDSGYVGKRLELPDRSKRGTLQRMFMDECKRKSEMEEDNPLWQPLKEEGIQIIYCYYIKYNSNNQSRLFSSVYHV